MAQQQQQQQRGDEFENATRTQDRDQSDRRSGDQFATDPATQYTTYYETTVAAGYGAPVTGVPPPGAYGMPNYGTNVGGTNYDPAAAGYGTTGVPGIFGTTTGVAGYGTGSPTGFGTAGVGAGQWGQDATAAGGGGGEWGQDATTGGGGGSDVGMDMNMNMNKGRDQK